MTNAHACRGCETWVVREGYEGLVRGNGEEHKAEKVVLPSHKEVHVRDETFVHNLRFGDGELLRDGTSDHPTGRTLKGRYIVRVGWDDVRGWFGVVSPGSLADGHSLTCSLRVAHCAARRVRQPSALQKVGWPQHSTSSKKESTPSSYAEEMAH